MLKKSELKKAVTERRKKHLMDQFKNLNLKNILYKPTYFFKKINLPLREIFESFLLKVKSIVSNIKSVFSVSGKNLKNISFTKGIRECKILNNKIKVNKDSSEKIKFVKISKKVIICACSIILLATATSITISQIKDYIKNMETENSLLKEQLSAINAINYSQSELLDKKIREMDSLTKKDTSLEEKVKQFDELYKDITNKYIDNRVQLTMSNRSSDERTDRSFVNEIEKLQSVLTSLEEINKNQDEITGKLSETKEKLNQYLSAIPTKWPVSGRITSRFGTRNDPFNYDEKMHEGIDIAAPNGTSIKAAARGTVVYAGTNGNYGKCIIISHGNGIRTLYAHASKLFMEEGDTVNKGDTIAQVGSTGRSTGDHLHFEVQLNGTPVDPLKYIGG